MLIKFVITNKLKMNLLFALLIIIITLSFSPIISYNLCGHTYLKEKKLKAEIKKKMKIYKNINKNINSNIKINSEFDIDNLPNNKINVEYETRNDWQSIRI